jgi:hypothetical protein
VKELEEVRVKDLAQWAEENKAWKSDRERLENVIKLHKQAIADLEADLEHSSHRSPDAVRNSLNRLLMVSEEAGVPRSGPSPTSGGPPSVPGGTTSNGTDDA